MTDERSNGDERLTTLLADYREALLNEGGPSDPAQPALVAEFGPRLEAARQCLARLEALRREDVEDTSVGGGSTDGPGRNGVAEPGLRSMTVDHPSGGRIGRFEVRRTLGAGSHGIVYLARDPVLDRDVALKVPRPETLASPDLRSRFLREAQTVAELAHPHLVPVYEVGELGPACYIASQFCGGPTLAAWLRDRQGPVASHLAVALVKTLAKTVDYVHQRGILHRDIKPANVLLAPFLKVDETGRQIDNDPFPFELKLTDFGLAKLTDGSPASTRTGAVLGTPDYMAPEQAEGRGDRLGPATDVYALGAMLYELLTGSPPFRGATDLDTLRRVTESRLISPRRLRRDVPRDLEAICLKCLEFEPHRRYPSAGALGEDLRRFLADEPVSARRAGPLLRLTKSLKRKPVVSTLVLSLVLALVIGVSVATWLWRRSEQNYQMAEESFRDSHQVVHEFHSILYEGGKYDDPRFQPLRKELLETGLKYYRRLLKRHGDDEAVQADAAGTLYEMAFIAQTTGSKTKALQIYNESNAIWQSLVKRNPSEPKYQYYLGKTLNRIGILRLEQGKPGSALESWRRSLAVWEALTAAYPANSGYRRELGYAYLALTRHDRFTQRWEPMRKNAEAAKRVFLALARRHPENGELGRMLAVSYVCLAKSCSASGASQQAGEFLERAGNVCEDLVRRKVDMPSSAKTLAQILLDRGRLAQARKDPVRARSCFLRSNVILRELHKKFPATITYMRELATSHWQLAHLLKNSPDGVERHQHLLQALVLRRRLVQSNPLVCDYRIDLSRVLIDLAEHSRRRGDRNDALRHVKDAEDVLAKCPPARRLWTAEIERLQRTLTPESPARSLGRESAARNTLR